jgi:glycosyltransferase involved in cell wall biosynthesis
MVQAMASAHGADTPDEAKVLVEILLATYQGASFLSEQLDSLFAQTRQDFRIVVRDDGSTDDTRKLVEQHVVRHPGRIVLLAADGERLGASGSFARLLTLSQAPYVMFCDQDDVWTPDKVAVSLAAMHDLERSQGKDTPLLVSTDLKVVDERLNLIAESFWAYQRIHPERLKRLSRVLVQNFATGCTVMVNRPLINLATPIPAEAIMHDWWLALVATRFGQAQALARTTVLYRQHGRNDVGARRWHFKVGVKNFFFHREGRQAAIAEQEKVYVKLETQALAFARRFGARLDPDERATLGALAEFRRRRFFGRRYLMLRHGLLQSDRWQVFMGLVH